MKTNAVELLRIARELISSDKSAELKQKLETIVYGDYKIGQLTATLQWIKSNFNYDVSRGKQGFKPVRDAFTRFFDILKDAEGSKDSKSFVTSVYESRIKDKVDEFAELFATTDNSTIKIGNYEFVNGVGFSQDNFLKQATNIARVFDEVKGWRRKAFDGGLKVIFSGAHNFNGTASGKYSVKDDTLYIRATSNVLKRGKGYGSPEYVLIHELGHRYEYKNPKADQFNKFGWQTTSYSFSEDEAFAELFALGHFNIISLRDKNFSEKLEAFEKEMN
jgi:hypothetical protein